MNAASLGLRLALVASVAANIYLIAAGPGTRRVGLEQAHTPETTRESSQRPSQVPPQDPCIRSLRVATRKLSDAERTLAEKLRLPERFERGQPDPASKQRLEAFMAEVFGGGLAYTVVECRNRICKLDVPGDDRDWMAPLQAEGSEQALLDGGQFGHEVFLVIMEEPRQRGWKLALDVARRLRESRRIAQCKPEPAIEGDVRLNLDVNADDRFDVSYAGSLADTPLGACIRAAVDAELAAVKIPPDTAWPEKLRDFGVYP